MAYAKKYANKVGMICKFTKPYPYIFLTLQLQTNVKKMQG